MDLKITPDYKAILEKLGQIDPVKYGKTRNFVDGAVTCLSPYLSRGIISTKQVLESVLKRGYEFSQIELFVKELCWRDYFQRIAQVKDLHGEIVKPQTPVLNYEISSSILNATTGIQGVDKAIKQLYQNGYMYNHCRMYTASLVCNIAKSHWHHPAQWMYYHLLDGDWASNACSWQWVAGANSNKKYYANQENINKYTHTNQVNTYLDKSYERLESMETPAQLLGTQKLAFTLELPETGTIHYNSGLPTFIYNYYNLDPIWHKDVPGNRILLIEPGIYSKYPVSKNCIDFMISASKNIPDIQIYVGSFKSFSDNFNTENIYYKEHPFNSGYRGIKEERDWIAADVSGYFPSFFSYWKKIEKYLHK